MYGKVVTYTVLVSHDIYSSDVSMVHARVHGARTHDSEVAHAPGMVERTRRDGWSFAASQNTGLVMCLLRSVLFTSPVSTLVTVAKN